MRDKGANLVLTHFAGMALVMEENEPTDPTDVRLLCTNAQVAHASHGAYLSQQPGSPVDAFVGFDGESGKHPSIIRIDASKKSCNRL